MTQDELAFNIHQYIHWFTLKFHDSTLEDRFMEQRLQPFLHYRYSKYAVIMYLVLCSVRVCLTILGMILRVGDQSSKDDEGLPAIIAFFVVCALEALCAYTRLLRWFKGALWITYAYVLISYGNTIVFPNDPGFIPMYVEMLTAP